MDMDRKDSIVGFLARSKAGHDKGEVHVIVREDAESVFLADGRARTAEKPKRKNKKHIQLIRKKELPGQTGGFRDLEIKRVIKEYLSEIGESEERNVKG